MFNYEDEKIVGKLCAAVKASRQALEPFRRSRTDLVKEFVGSHYSEDAAKETVICNVLAEAEDVSVMHLAPTIPKVLVSTDYVEHKVVARDMEIAINNDFEKLELERTLKKVASDAWFAMGIVKVSLAEGNVIEVAGEAIDIGQLSVHSISLDNWFHDNEAKRWEDCDFYGDLYRVREDQMESIFGVEDISEFEESSRNTRYDEAGGGKTEAISKGTNRNSEEPLFKYVEVMDVFLPKDQVLVTLPVGKSGTYVKPLRVVEWAGPKRGPYHFLSLSEVPDNIMPNAPGMQLHELNKWISNLHRKLNNQSKRQKTIGVGKRGADQDIQSIMDASDGEVVGVEEPESLKEMRLGGIDQQNQGVVIWLMDLFDRLAGNVRAMGGTGQSADTLGQEQIVFQQLGVRLEKQKQKMRQLIKEIAEDIAWWRWHDPFYSVDTVRKVPNTNVQVIGKFGPQDRVAEFIKFNFSIDPYSMEYVPPSAKLQSIQEFIGGFILPLMPMMEQQGVTLNMEEIIKTASRYSNMPELLDAFTFIEGEQTARPQPAGMDRGRAPAVTRRENVRINQSGGNESPSDQLLSKFLGGNINLNQNEGASV